MGETINLNKARKAKARAGDKAAADANAAKHGRTKAETMLENARAAKAARELAALKRE